MMQRQARVMVVKVKLAAAKVKLCVLYNVLYSVLYNVFVYIGFYNVLYIASIMAKVNLRTGVLPTV